MCDRGQDVRGKKRKSEIDVEGATITNRSSLIRVIETIKLHLDEGNMKLFQQTCFGSYLKFGDMVFQGPLMYMLLLSLDHSSRGEGVLRFKVNGLEATFGPEEYLAITGFSFGPAQELPITSDFYRTAFGLTRSISTRDLEKKFKKTCSSSSGQSEIALKLALNLFLYGVLIGPGFISHKLNMKYFHVVDNVSLFNLFPWGRESYDYLVHEFFESAERVNIHIAGERKPNVDVNGFMLALQVWAFDVYPEIGNTCGSLYNNFDPIAPRIFRWASDSSVGYSDFQSYLEQSPVMRKEAFKMSRHEEELIINARPYNSNFRSSEARKAERSIIGLLGPVSRKLKFSLNSRDDEYFAGGQSSRVTDEGELPSEECTGLTRLCKNEKTPNKPSRSAHDSVIYMLGSISSQLSGWLENFIRVNQRLHVVDETMTSNSFLCNAISKMKKEVDAMKDSVEVNCLQNISTGTFDLNFGNMAAVYEDRDPFLSAMCEGAGRMDMTFDSSWIDENYPPIQSLSTLRASSLPHSEPPSDCCIELSSEPSRDFMASPAKNGSSGMNQSFHDEISSHSNSAANKSVTKPLPIMKYSPMKKYPKARVQVFLDWYRNAKERLNSRTFRIPLRILSIVDFEWITILKRTNDNDDSAWLNDEHCDVLLNLLIFKSRRVPHMFNTQWCCVEHPFWSKCVNSPFDDAKEPLMRYVLGEYPLEGGLPWCDAMKVFGIAHVSTNHWVAYEINLLDHTIIVYDSMAKVNSWEHIKAQFTNLSRYVPRLLTLARDSNEDFGRFKAVPEWPVVESEMPPQQLGGVNCGIMAVKFIECLASGFPIANIKADKCSKMRLYYCAQLFNAGDATDH